MGYRTMYVFREWASSDRRWARATAVSLHHLRTASEMRRHSLTPLLKPCPRFPPKARYWCKRNALQKEWSALRYGYELLLRKSPQIPRSFAGKRTGTVSQFIGLFCVFCGAAIACSRCEFEQASNWCEGVLGDGFAKTARFGQPKTFTSERGRNRYATLYMSIYSM